MVVDAGRMQRVTPRFGITTWRGAAPQHGPVVGHTFANAQLGYLYRLVLFL